MGIYYFGGWFIRFVICYSVKSIIKSDLIKLVKYVFRGENFGLIDWFFIGGLDIIKDKSISIYKENVDYMLNKKLVKCGGFVEVDFI